MKFNNGGEIMRKEICGVFTKDIEFAKKETELLINKEIPRYFKIYNEGIYLGENDRYIFILYNPTHILRHKINYAIIDVSTCTLKDIEQEIKPIMINSDQCSIATRNYNELKIKDLIDIFSKVYSLKGNIDVKSVDYEQGEVNLFNVYSNGDWIVVN